MQEITIESSFSCIEDAINGVQNPEKPSKPQLGKNPTPGDLRQHADLLEAHEAAMATYQAKQNDARAQKAALQKLWQEKLFKEACSGMSERQLTLIYEHVQRSASGLYDIRAKFEELVMLVDDIIDKK